MRNTNKKKIYIGMPNENLPGGVNSAETLTIKQLMENNKFDVHIFYFGSRRPNESFFTKLLQRTFDLIVFTIRISKTKYDLIHINSALDKNAVLRDSLFVAVTRIIGIPLFIKYHGSDFDFLQNSKFGWKFLISYCIKYVVGVGVLSTEEKSNFEIGGFNSDKDFVLRN